MIMHAVTFRWHDDVTEAQVKALTDALSALPDKIPVLLSYRFGRDLGQREGNGDYAAALPDAESIPAYLDHPAHIDVVQRYTSKMIADRISVQFTLPQ